MSKLIDLSNMKFGRLTVIKRMPNKSGKTQWLCQCDCEKHNQIVVYGENLKRKYTQSCGCLHTEMLIRRNKRYNEYEIQEDYVIMYTAKNDLFLVDLDDFWKVKNICWCKNSNGYFVGQVNGKKVFLHNYIMNCPKGLMVDHIKENSRYDNRKDNLRIVKNVENSWNHKKFKTNTSGYTGVSYDKAKKYWFAYIWYHRKRISLGYHKNIENAIKARKEAETKYYGEYANRSDKLC